MITSAKFTKAAVAALLVAVAATPAQAHVDAGATSSFAAGFGHPLAGLDHLAVMVAVGLWAVLRGGGAVWAWPLAFIGFMVAGAVLGMSQVPVPFVEPGILASVVVLGMLVALAVDVPILAGTAIIGAFAILHGHAHGTESPASAAGLSYVAGFVVATCLLHGAGLAAATALGPRLRGLTRAAGLACAAIGTGLVLNLV